MIANLGPGDATIAAALRLGRTTLAQTRSETPGLDAEVLLRHALGIDRAALFSHLSEPIEPVAFDMYVDFVARRAKGEPIAYITGQREFMGLTFAVTPSVLIPRPETEILVEWAISWLHDRESAIVVDVGTGSGAIALSLAAHLGPGWGGRIIAADVSPTALTVAAGNRERIGLTHQQAPSPPAGSGEAARESAAGRPEVALVQGSLLSWLRGAADLLLANLPYLRPDQIGTNSDLAAEPALALDGGADGLDLVRPLIADAPRVLARGGAIGIEIDPSQRGEVERLARESFPESDVEVLFDLAGLDRHILILT